MWKSFHCSLIFGLSLVAAPHPARAETNVNGSVSITRSTGLIRSVPPSDVVITLTPLSAEPEEREPERHVVDMRDKNFMPGYLIVRPGDTVEFRNSDPFKHNVFSLTEGHEFDLGLYGPDKELAQTFEGEGVVHIYCNVHPDMACFVVSTHAPFHHITDNTGTFNFEDVPPGRYTLRAWSLRGSVEQTVTVQEDQALDIEIEIDATENAAQGHRDKEGKRYPRNFDDDESY